MWRQLYVFVTSGRMLQNTLTARGLSLNLNRLRSVDTQFIIKLTFCYEFFNNTCTLCFQSYLKMTWLINC